MSELASVGDPFGCASAVRTRYRGHDVLYLRSVVRTTTTIDDTTTMASSDKHETLDPVFAQAVNNNITPEQKIKDLKEVVHAVKTGMLTSRDKSGYLHARAMTPASSALISISFLSRI